MFCIECGNMLPNEAKFCFMCGQPTHADSTGQSSANTAAQSYNATTQNTTPPLKITSTQNTTPPLKITSTQNRATPLKSAPSLYVQRPVTNSQSALSSYRPKQNNCIVPDYGKPTGRRKGIAILLWFLGYFGFLGFHNYYLGEWKYALARLAMTIGGYAFIGIGGARGRFHFMIIGGLTITTMFVLTIVEISKIGTNMPKFGWTQTDIQAYQAFAKEEKMRRIPKKQTLINIVISILMSLVLLIGGISGKLAFIGTNSGIPLIIIGVAFSIWTVVSAIRYANQRKTKANIVSVLS